MFAWLSKLILYVYDQFVSVAIMEYISELIVKRHLYMNRFSLFEYTLLYDFAIFTQYYIKPPCPKNNFP